MPQQSVFYPVLNQEYAIEIAQKWNALDETSGFSGYVTEFNMEAQYVLKYESHIVGSSIHEELWVPAEDLIEFNSYIKVPILICNAFYGEKYADIKKHVEKLIYLSELKKYNPMDFYFLGYIECLNVLPYDAPNGWGGVYYVDYGGANVKNDLLNFYQQSENDDSIEKTNFIEINNKSCLILFQTEGSIIVGITNDGDWFWKTSIEFLLLKEKRLFLRLIRLLEIPLTEIEKQIDMRLNKYIKDYDVKKIFPFFDIVQYVFYHGPSVYWIELAYSWFGMLNPEQKQELMPRLSDLATNKGLSQSLRRKIRKDIKNHEMIKASKGWQN